MKILYDERQLYATLDEAGICRVFLNNPQKLNALNTSMAEGAKELAPLIQNTAARVIVFTGQGRAFCAGGDLQYLQYLSTLPAEKSAEAMLQFYAPFLELFRLPLPTIAHINGPCIGAGFCLALACDLRYAYSGVPIGMNFVRIGINPGMGAEFWAARENSLMLREMLLTGRIYSSSEDRVKPLFNQVGSPEEIAHAVEQAAEAIAANSPQAIKISLPLIRNRQLSLEQVLQAEAEGQGHCLSTGEIQQAIAAQRAGGIYKFQF